MPTPSPKAGSTSRTPRSGSTARARTRLAIYQWEYLLRYGLTDNLEFRIFSNGLTAQARQGKQAATTGYSPLAFDFKANFWEENTKYHIPAMGIEIYLQTTFGSPAFNGGTQPSMNLLFDQSLPLGIGFEYNFGITGVQNGLGQIKYQFSYQWSFQRQVVKDFDVFVHGFYNAASCPACSSSDPCDIFISAPPSSPSRRCNASNSSSALPNWSPMSAQNSKTSRPGIRPSAMCAAWVFSSPLKS